MPFLRTILVDDEPHCQQTLSSLLARHFPQLQIVAVCSNGSEAQQKIAQHQPDLVFLDIEMPAPNGFEVLQNLGNQFTGQVIFTTAHSQHAVRAFRFAAADFLLKPITETDLREAMSRAENRWSTESRARQFSLLFEAVHLSKNSKQVEKIALPGSDGLEIVAISQISHIVADQRYCQFFLADGRKIMVSRNLGEYEEILDPEIFLRLHRSHIANLNYIKKYQRGEGGQVQMSGGQWLEVSRAKKEDLLSKLGVKN